MSTSRPATSNKRPEQSLDKDCKKFTEMILQAAKKSTPSSSGKASKPWWNEKCAAPKRECNQALRRLRTSRTEEAISIYQQARLDLEKTIITEKGESWKSFASELTPSIPSTKVWNTMKAMDGRSRSNLPGVPIIEDGKERAIEREKAEATVKAYARVSRLKVERVHEKDAYNKDRRAVTAPIEEEDFTMDELISVTSKLKKNAPGADEIHPMTLKHLPAAGRERLLDILNRSWREGRVPANWRRAIIVPILKKNKPPNQVKSYRPVSLLSVTSKVMETIITKRLKKWAWDNKIIPEQQSGFQPRRSTLDVIASVTQRAFDGLQHRKRSLVVGIDFRAAFDRVWRTGLLRDLATYGCPPMTLHWIRAWLTDRVSAVRWNESTSSYKVFQQGVPQGSPLSPLLFCLATASLPPMIQAAAPETTVDIFVDDLTAVTQDQRWRPRKCNLPWIA